MHSSVGRHLHINTAGSFRKITFSRQDWTMVNMSYHKPSLKYPHSNSRQSGRRTNKRKRVSRHSYSLFGQLLVVFFQPLSVYLRWSGAVEKMRIHTFWRIPRCDFSNKSVVLIHRNLHWDDITRCPTSYQTHTNLKQKSLGLRTFERVIRCSVTVKNVRTCDTL